MKSQFPPNINFWLNADNTYRVVFIQVSVCRLWMNELHSNTPFQSQASWFVVTGSDFEIDAHNTGGIQGNGQARIILWMNTLRLNQWLLDDQPWWSFFATPPQVREDGDGRPISLTLWKVARGTISNFRIESPPFWSNAVVESSDVVYNGMFINATNTDPLFFGQKWGFHTTLSPCVWSFHCLLQYCAEHRRHRHLQERPGITAQLGCHLWRWLCCNQRSKSFNLVSLIHLMKVPEFQQHRGAKHHLSWRDRTCYWVPRPICWHGEFCFWPTVTSPNIVFFQPDNVNNVEMDTIQVF